MIRCYGNLICFWNKETQGKKGWFRRNDAKSGAVICDTLRDWYHLYNLENVKNTNGIMLLFKLQAKACNFTTKSNIPPWVFFTV